MTLEWNRLPVLDAVARTGSVAGAADLLHLTGPAISRQLRRLEADAGTAVVAPAGRGIRLTPAGRTLAQCARSMADLVQKTENELASNRPQVEHVRVAAIASAIRDLLADRVASFGAKHPEVHVHVRDGETVDHLDLLRRGHVDIVLAESWSACPLPVPARTRVHRMASTPAVLALPSGHRLAHTDPIPLAALDGEVWTTCADGSDAHTALVRAAREHGMEIDVRYHVADHATQLALVRAGLAVACLPAPPSPDTVDTDVVLRDLDIPPRRDLLLLTADRTLPVATSELVDVLTT